MSVLAGAALRLVSVTRLVAIRDCVHYCGFRYGRRELNPYEQYQHGLAAGLPRAQVREAFEAFLRHYRPRTLGEALGLTLSRDYPLWELPWRSPRRHGAQAWVATAAQVVDVMTHFSSGGIPRELVMLEHAWHERAFERMSREGYKPSFLRHARVVALASDERTAYLVVDGNHRISALSALGSSALTVMSVVGSTVHRRRAEHWPLVRSGEMTLDDALAVFDVYHHGNLAPPQAAVAAELV